MTLSLLTKSKTIFNVKQLWGSTLTPMQQSQSHSFHHHLRTPTSARVSLNLLSESHASKFPLAFVSQLVGFSAPPAVACHLGRSNGAVVCCAPSHRRCGWAYSPQDTSHRQTLHIRASARIGLHAGRTHRTDCKSRTPTAASWQRSGTNLPRCICPNPVWSADADCGCSGNDGRANKLVRSCSIRQRNCGRCGTYSTRHSYTQPYQHLHL